MKPRYFCTLFDSNYLLKGLAMLRSLERQCPNARVFVLCMDQTVQTVLGMLGLKHVTCIPLSDFEDETLLAAKKTRGVVEYFWTLSPCLPWYVLQHNPEIDFITYLDADLYFYSSVQPLFDEIGESSIAIIEHRFTPRLQSREVNGRFCVEWVSFRRDEEGMACLSRWRDQCIEWCYYRLESGRMGDQKYLDEWPARYPSCHILQHAGAGIAPWNYAQYSFGQDRRGGITVEGEPLIFFHFHQFQLLNDGGFDRLSYFYTREREEPAALYEVYETALVAAIAEVRTYSPAFSAGMKSATLVTARRWVQRYTPQSMKDLLHRFIRY